MVTDHSLGNSHELLFFEEDREKEPKLEALVAEFVGSFFLVLTIGFNVLQRTALAPLSIGSMLMAMIFATSKVSGAHFNPAVTFGVYLRGGKMDGETALKYVAVQILGAIVAGCIYLAVLHATFTIGPGTGYAFGSVFLVEMLFTAALVFVVLSVGTTQQDDGNWYSGLAIGFTVMAAAFAIGPISGCSLNPAVTIGVMFSHFIHTGHLPVVSLIVYTLAQLVGALLAHRYFQVVRKQEILISRIEASYKSPPLSPLSSVVMHPRADPHLFGETPNFGETQALFGSGSGSHYGGIREPLAHPASDSGVNIWNSTPPTQSPNLHVHSVGFSALPESETNSLESDSHGYGHTGYGSTALHCTGIGSGHAPRIQHEHAPRYA